MAREVATYAIQVRRGAAVDLAMTWTEDDDTPIDLTDATIELHYRIGSTVTTWNTGDEIEITDAEAGEFRILVEDTEELEAGSGRYSMFATRSGGEPQFLAEGTFSILDSVLP